MNKRNKTIAATVVALSMVFAAAETEFEIKTDNLHVKKHKISDLFFPESSTKDNSTIHPAP